MATSTAESDQLSTQLTDLGRHEDIIERGQAAGRKAWLSLKEIRDGGLYSARGYKTFESYCSGEWGIGKSQAYNHIAAAETSKLLESSVPQNLCDEISSERQLRELKDVPKGKLSKVVAVAGSLAKKESKTRITAAHLKKAREEVIAPPVPKQIAPPAPAAASSVAQDPASTMVDTDSLPVAAEVPQDEVFDKNKEKALEDLRMLSFHLSNLGLGQRWSQTIDAIKAEVQAK